MHRAPSPRLCHRLAHRFDEYLRDFWTGELAWWNLARLQHLAHPGATKRHVLLIAMRAGFRRCHRITGAAEEGMIEEHGRDAKLRGIKVREYIMRIIRAVIVAYACMVAPHDEMRTPVVLAHQRAE